MAKFVVKGLLRDPAVQETSGPGEPEGKLPRGDHEVNGLTVRPVGAAPEKVHIVPQPGSRLILKVLEPGEQANTPVPVDEVELSKAQLVITPHDNQVPKGPPVATEKRTGCPCVSVPTPADTVLAGEVIDVTKKAGTETDKPANCQVKARVPAPGEPPIVHKSDPHVGSVLNLNMFATIALPGLGQANTPPPETEVDINVAQLVIPGHPPHVASTPPVPVKYSFVPTVNAAKVPLTWLAVAVKDKVPTLVPPAVKVHKGEHVELTLIWKELRPIVPQA